MGTQESLSRVAICSCVVNLRHRHDTWAREHREVYHSSGLRRKVGNGLTPPLATPTRRNVHTQEHVPRRVRRRRNCRALLLVPTAAYAGTLYNGIVGASGQKANVSSANQLLTTEALPTSYRSYTESYLGSSTGHLMCTPLTKALPPGDAYNMQDLNLDTVSGATVEIFAAPANYRATFGSLSLILRTVTRSIYSQASRRDGPSSTVTSSLPVTPQRFRVEMLTAGRECPYRVEPDCP